MLASHLGPRLRVIYANDLSGDVDGKFATLHLLLCESVDVRAVVGTFAEPGSAGAAAVIGERIAAMVDHKPAVPVLEGAPEPLKDRATPSESAASRAIIDEAMRDEPDLPSLVVAVGGALTDVASALLARPEIAERMTVVWIGGAPYPSGGWEPNLYMDIAAAQVVFDSKVALWQVPQDVYLSCQVSQAELELRVGPRGEPGRWLIDELRQESANYAADRGVNTGETWTLGDSPLVLLTALTHQNPALGSNPHRYDRTGSSPFEMVVAPSIDDRGRYGEGVSGREIRVYRGLDTRMMFEDFFARMELAFGAAR